MKIALINTNRMQPPIAPIGLDYVADALASAGHSVHVLDLCWEQDPNSAIARFFKKSDFGMIGMTLRNTDDCAFVNCQSFLAGFVDLVEIVRKNSAAPIVLGGVGFSIISEKVLSLSKADFGIWGDGEFAVADLAERLEKGQSWNDLPNLLWFENGKPRRNPPAWKSLESLPAMSRSWVNNRQYFRLGGQAGFETKRGCPGACIYCADPPAKGKRVRVRLPGAVAEELEKLLAQKVDVLHTCDAEFNIPEWHAMEICSEMIRRELGDRIRWYAYCSPGCFSQELARSMRRAGCVGINFGVDNGNDKMLKRLGRDFTAVDIFNAARWSKKEGISVMLDLLLGAPGETRESIEQTVELMKRIAPDRVGVALGVRIYPGTTLNAQIGGGDSIDPVFFLEPQIAPFVFDWLPGLIGEDKRFLFMDASKPRQNYNYNANERLAGAIQAGYRGAYWDILRLVEDIP